jgi:nitroreductase
LLHFIAHQCYSLNENNLDIRLVEMSLGNNNSMRIDYGLVRNHHSYLLAKCENSTLERVNYGFLLEQVVLKATELGLATCWIGYFDPAFFSNLLLAENERIPSIVNCGIPE